MASHPYTGWMCSLQRQTCSGRCIRACRGHLPDRCQRAHTPRPCWQPLCCPFRTCGGGHINSSESGHCHSSCGPARTTRFLLRRMLKRMRSFRTTEPAVKSPAGRTIAPHGQRVRFEGPAALHHVHDVVKEELVWRAAVVGLDVVIDVALHLKLGEGQISQGGKLQQGRQGEAVSSTKTAATAKLAGGHLCGSRYKCDPAESL